MGFSVSQAQAKYEKDDSRVEVEIMDTGGVGGMAMMGTVSYTHLDVYKRQQFTHSQLNQGTGSAPWPPQG